MGNMYLAAARVVGDGASLGHEPLDGGGEHGAGGLLLHDVAAQVDPRESKGLKP
jgi:hypothetical protein